MKCARHLVPAFVLIAIMGVLVPSVTHAEILGFRDFSDFAINQNDSLSPPVISIPNGSIQLTSGGGGAYRSIYCKIPQSISSFTASFTYQATGSNYYNPGTSFVLQNSVAGPNALTTGSFGYGGLTGPSAAFTFETDNDKSGFYTNGNVGGGSPTVTPVSLFSGNPINVTLSYNGTILQESLFDPKTTATYNASYLVNLPTVLNGNTAYVGFATTAGGYGLTQTISNFYFTVPEPSTLALLGISTIGLLVCVWQRRWTT